MRSPFEPVGEKARWEPVYALFKGRSVGDLITYEQLTKATGVDFKINRHGLSKAVRLLEEREQRTIVCVRNQGYAIAPASAHETLAKARRKRAKTQIKRAVSLATNVKKAELTPEQLKRLEDTEVTLRAHSDMLGRVERRVERQELTLKAVRRDTKAATASNAELTERMQRLEALALRAGFAVDELTR